MPRRTNDFQSVVHAIELASLGSGIRLTESKEFYDPQAGIRREVDLVLETEVNGHPVVAGIECTAPGRRSTVEWVEQIRGKHQTLKIDKTILVTRRALSKSAARKALAKVLVYLIDQANYFQGGSRVQY